MANRQRDLGKEQFWRQMVARQRQSDLTIRAFCGHAGLSQASFYQWRRELVRRDRTRPSARAAFVPLQLVPDAAVIEIVLGQSGKAWWYACLQGQMTRRCGRCWRRWRPAPLAWRTHH